MVRSSVRLVGIVIVGILLISGAAIAQDVVYRIQVGNDWNGSGYSENELRRRVWELERAVNQLQLRVYQLEASPPAPPPTPLPEPPWTCTVVAFGRAYNHTAKTQGQARAGVLEKCTQTNNAMHCDRINCTQ